MKRICLIGQFPPPIHGLSKALETIVQSDYLKDKYELNCVDIKDNKRFISNLRKIEKWMPICITLQYLKRNLGI